MDTVNQADTELGAKLGLLQDAAAEADATEGVLIPDSGHEQAAAGELEPESSVPTLPTAEAMTMLVTTVTNVVAVRRGDFWKLDPVEAQAVGEAYGALIEAWFPAEKVGPGVMAIMVTGMVFGPRIIADRQAHGDPEPEKKPTDNGGQDTNPGSARAPVHG